MGVLEKVLRAGEGKKLRRLQGIVPFVNELEPQIKGLSDDALRHKTVEFRQRLDRGEDLDDLLVEAFAVVREAAQRTIGQRHYDVQLMGGMALHFGWIAEMKTGEGKTLVSTLPVYLNGLTGRGVHVVTVNDYLARRDAEWMGHIHRWLGITVGLVVPDQPTPEEKRVAYGCDVTYGTNTEFGFDYLRDNMAPSRDHMVQRGHVFAIVDEVDSILIDEARTPLIISGQGHDATELYAQFAKIVPRLVKDEDFTVDEKKKTVAPTEEGVTRVEEALGVENLYDNINQNFVHQLQAALRAKELFKRDVDYVVADGEVKIVDEFTGRILEGRRWSEGLHQAVEAKEGVKIKEENQTLATITLQNYFRLYDKLSGMTGTGVTEAGEFAHTYNVEVVPIPTNKPMIRADQGDLIYKTEEAKFNAVVDDLVERHEKGQPVLVGTISVEKSEYLSRQLDKRGIPHTVLNAKQHEREAHIVTQAGRIGSVTVATNMAGRGVDIILGGNPEGLADQEIQREGSSKAENPERWQELYARFKPECDAEGQEVREVGGLYVLGTERHESRRIDNQLRGRSGRQGDPGESRFYLSLEDDLMRIFATGAMNWVMGKALPDDVPIEAKMVSKAIERAQRTVEDRNFEIRKDVLKYDEVMNEQRKVVYKRRQMVLDGEDLKEQALEAIQAAITRAVDTFLPGDFEEEWDFGELLSYVAQYYPTDTTVAVLEEIGNRYNITDHLIEEALAKYEEKEATVGEENLREIERRVMLSVIDQKWREHLYEMDYLQEGINLRAMGQRDPLVEWQREGFDMFEAMMGAVEDDFVRYVFHLQVVREEAPAPQRPRRLQYSAAEDPVQGSEALRQTAVAEAAAGGLVDEEAVADAQVAVQAPVRVEKVPGRNDPCYCGSGKKYKFCHGR
ncbi:MAG TPA: preprotein translocase subunit SecA [Acidimicrobiales bacterium]|nr:preprotein translocase subunit SecA [Acidimicrobiales bacterium]